MSDWATRDIPKPNAFIQWKGTNVCMDCHCPCGHHFHIDMEFTYAVQCPQCQRRFEMSAVIEMRELLSEEKWDGPIFTEVVEKSWPGGKSSHTEEVRRGG